MAYLPDIEGILFDLDGVLFIGDKIIDGACETVEYVKSKKLMCRFLTNTTTRSLDSLYEKIRKMELPIEKEEIFAPPKIAARYLKQYNNPKLLLILEENTKTEFDEFEIDEENPDFIVLGHYGEKWDYPLMSRLFNLVMNGSKILALHKGRYWQTQKGLTLDIGAFVTGLEHATSQQAIVVGKPEPTFFKMALEDMGLGEDKVIMVGDDIINDIGGATNCGIRSVLVKTGKYREEIYNSSEIKPDILIDSVKNLIDII